MNIPVKLLLFVLTCSNALVLCTNLHAQNKKSHGVHTVVIDAGHGGNDPGAVYGGVREKDVNLKVALKLGKIIGDNCSDVKVVYTRNKDVAVGLAERGNIANKAGANLFISIHADAAQTNARGATTFIMGVDKNENNLREAMRENDVMKYEDDYSEKYEGFNPTSAESYIIFSLMQYAYFDQSLQFAGILQKHYKAETALADRGAKQAPFYVLWKTAMPSVLTEMGFLSNEEDRKYINSEKGQNEIAKAIFEGFLEYKSAVDKKESTESDDAATTAVTASPAKESATPSKTVKKENSATVVTPSYFVQLCTSRTKISTKDARFGSHKDKVVEKHIDGWYKYYFGGYSSLEEAIKIRDEVKKGAFKDAFIIALDGDKQISIEQARKQIASQIKK